MGAYHIFILTLKFVPTICEINRSMKYKLIKAILHCSVGRYCILFVVVVVVVELKLNSV